MKFQYDIVSILMGISWVSSMISLLHAFFTFADVLLRQSFSAALFHKPKQPKHQPTLGTLTPSLITNLKIRRWTHPSSRFIKIRSGYVSKPSLSLSLSLQLLLRNADRCWTKWANELGMDCPMHLSKLTGFSRSRPSARMIQRVPAVSLSGWH